MTARSRYDGFPQVFLSGDKEKALAHLGRAKSLLSEVQRIREVAGVPVFQRALRTEDVEIIAKSLGETNAIYVHGFEVKGSLKDPVMYEYPVVLSGYIEARLINPETPDLEFLEFKRAQKAQRVAAEAAEQGLEPDEEDMRLTAEEEEAGRQPTGSFAPTRETVNAYASLLDVADIRPHKTNVLRADTAGAYKTFDAMNPETGAKYRAYRYVRGTWLTGHLSKCLQAVMGLHYEKSIWALQAEPTFLQADEGRALAYAASGARMALDSYVEMVDKARGFVGDYYNRWGKTDGLVRGFNGWWLVRVEVSRILARRLPVFYGSDLSEFVTHYRDIGLLRLAEFIEETGGLPTGESFGTAEDIAQGLAGGWVFDITPANMPLVGYSATYGYGCWSFSEDGREAHNVGKRYEAAEDMWYTRWASLRFEPVNIAGREELRARAMVNMTSAIFVPLRKMNRVPYQSIPLKLPVGYQGEVASLAFDTADTGFMEGRKKVYNAVVWVGYIEGALHTIHYYLNGLARAQSTPVGEPPPEDCNQGGAWEWGVDNGSRDVGPVVFSNQWDTREPLSAGGSRQKRESVKVAEYITGGHFIQAPEWSWYIPQVRFKVTQQQWTLGGDSYGSYITVYPDRSQYVCASRLTTAVKERHSITYRYETTGGPWTAYGFRCFVRIAPIDISCLTPGVPISKYCNQRCNYMVGGQHSDKVDRLICSSHSTPVGCEGHSTLEPPKRCTDMRPYLGATPQSEVLPDARVITEPEWKDTDSGVVYTPMAAQGWVYKPNGLDIDAVYGLIPRPSLDPYTQVYHRIASTRNCNGYEYTCFSINLLGTMGVKSLGGLHTGEENLKTTLTFVGVL